jgi:hypothetical protein
MVRLYNHVDGATTKDTTPMDYHEGEPAMTTDDGPVTIIKKVGPPPSP